MKEIERMVISAYEDGEVEAPWVQAVEQRLAQDQAWADEAQSIRRVKDALAASPEPDFSAARNRVAAQLSGLAPHRKVSRLPWTWVSVAAAALLVVATGTGFWIGRQSVGSSSTASVAELEVQVPKQLELKLSGEGQLLMASTLERTNP